MRSTSSLRAVSIITAMPRVVSSRWSSSSTSNPDMPGQHQVEHDQRGMLAARDRERVGPGRGGRHAVAGLREVVHDERDDIRLVVDDEHAFARRGRRRRRAHRRRRREPARDRADEQVDRDRVVPAARHDHVGVALARLDELQVHRLDGGEVLVEDFLQRAAALFHVAPDAPDEPHVGVGVDERLHVAARRARARRRTAGSRR